MKLAGTDTLQTLEHYIYLNSSYQCIGGILSKYCGDVIMGAIASQITSLTIVYSTVYSDADQRKHQSSASLAFVWGIHWGPLNSPHKWPVTRKMLPFDDVIMRGVSETLIRFQPDSPSVMWITAYKRSQTNIYTGWPSCPTGGDGSCSIKPSIDGRIPEKISCCSLSIVVRTRDIDMIFPKWFLIVTLSEYIIVICCTYIQNG